MKWMFIFNKKETFQNYIFHIRGMVKCAGDIWKELDLQVIMSPNRFQRQQKIPSFSVTPGEESGPSQLLTQCENLQAEKNTV